MSTESVSVTGQRTVVRDDGRTLPAVVLDAGELHVGQVGGGAVRAVPDALPATSTGAYAAGDVLGGKLKFSNALRVAAGSGLLQDLTLTLASVQTAALEMVLFRADPAASGFADNLAFAVAAADLDKVIGVVPFEAVGALGAGSHYEANRLARSLKLDAGRDLWAVPVWRGAATLATTADLAAVSATVLVD